MEARDKGWEKNPKVAKTSYKHTHMQWSINVNIFLKGRMENRKRGGGREGKGREREQIVSGMRRHFLFADSRSCFTFGFIDAPYTR